MKIFKNIMLVLLGVAITVGIASLAVCIGSAINGVSFNQQIVDWSLKLPNTTANLNII